MSTVGAVAIAIGGVASIWLLLLQRKQAREAKANEPGEQDLRRQEEAAREIAKGDEQGANVSLDDDLRRYRELRVQKPSAVQGDSGGPGGEPDHSGN